MAQDVLITIAQINSFDKLETLERNIDNRQARTPAIEAAINAKYAEFGRQIVAARTGLDLTDISSAEQRIVDAVGRYVGLQKRDGKGAGRTFQILKNRGLIEAAEVTVAKSKVTQGFTVLEQADLGALSFEQIIVDHPDEFSTRATWYARRTLGLGNDSEKPPADLGTLTQQRTEKVFDWLVERARTHHGRLSDYANADVGIVLGFDDLSKHGRVLGNIQSRVDFACYREGVPPLGLCARDPFGQAWGQESRDWPFPISVMQAAARSSFWAEDVIERVRRAARLLPGQAAIPWRREWSERESDLRQWAESLVPVHPDQTSTKDPDPDANGLADLERKLLGRRPEVRERISRSIERGSIGQKLKRANGFDCQICEALGAGQGSFIKPNGERYVEAHHATPVSEQEIGSLAAANIMILCANHHRQMHYGDVALKRAGDRFELEIDGRPVSITRFSLI